MNKRPEMDYAGLDRSPWSRRDFLRTASAALIAAGGAAGLETRIAGQQRAQGGRALTDVVIPVA
jgi:hypothetical protein